jgi:uncharacterized protein YecT (DUF1311 family)
LCQVETPDTTRIFMEKSVSVKSLIVTIIIALLPMMGNAQTIETIELLEQTTQKHLDKGVDMLGHTSTLYIQMDSLLNVVYTKLRKRLPDKEKDALKQKQLTWLKDRDRYFIQLYKDQEKESSVNKEGWGELEYLSIYRLETEFVKERVIFLINMLNNNELITH